MLFPTSTFLFLFLPLFLVTYFLLGRRNSIICIWSLLFYFYGEGWHVFILIGSTTIAYLHGLYTKKAGKSGTALASTVIIQLLILAYFKYSAFLATDVIGMSPEAWDWPILPIGISFFIFQAMSYSIDVHRGRHEAADSFIDVATYIALFPQLIAGPIVRYGTIDRQLKRRTIRPGNLNTGIYLFCVGLAQKVLIADKLAFTADGLFGLPVETLTTSLAWTAALAYTGQIYFDFAGYSNMAMGLGFMLGFRFPRNFNYPYVALSITTFWRRWHISLTSWFRDYVYIPLGGNRLGSFKTYRNLVIVFLLSGLWHGAAWTFVLWGAYHGLFLVIERLGLSRLLKKSWPPIAWIYTFTAVVFGWVLFRAESLDQCFGMMKRMIVPTEGDNSAFFLYSGVDTWLAMIAAIILSTGLVESKGKRMFWDLGARSKSTQVTIKLVVASLLFIVCTVEVMSSTYSPFIYFRF